MILGLPWTSWLLLLVGAGLGFGISLTFYLAHRGEGPGGPWASAGPDPPPGSEPEGNPIPAANHDPPSGPG